MMASIAIILFDANGMTFSPDMAIRREDFGKSLPVIDVEGTFFQMFHLVVQPLKRCSITTTDNPGNSFPCATIQGFNDPFLVFF